jgi:hypothetical protein
MIYVISLEFYNHGDMVSENRINTNPHKENSRRRKSTSSTFSKEDLADLLVFFFIF